MLRLCKNLTTLLVAVAALLANCQPVSCQSPDDYAHSWKIQSFYKDADLADKYVSMIDFEPDGSIWLAVTDGLYFYNGYKWTKYTTRHGLPSNYVRSVLVTRDGTLWVGTDNGAGIFRNGAFDAAGTVNNLAGPSIRRIVESNDGSIWFCCDQFPISDVTGGLTRLYQGQFKTWRSQDGLGSDYVSDFFQDSQGRQFILTNRGLSQLVGNDIQQPLQAAGIWAGDTYVWSIVESPIHGVMAATDSNFYVLKEDQWRRFPNAGPTIIQPKLGATRTGEVFTLTSESAPEIVRWNGDAFEKNSDPLNTILGDLQITRESPDGSIWFAGFERLLRWERIAASWELIPNFKSPVFKDAAGGVWFTLKDNAIARLHDDRLTKFEDTSPPLFEDKSGHVWMTAQEQVAVWKGGEVIEQLIVPGLQNAKPIAIDSLGASWVVGNNATNQRVIACYNNGDWTQHVLDAIDQDAELNHISIDPDDGIWAVLSHSGLSPYRILHVSKTAIEELQLPPQVTKSNPPKILVAGKDKIFLCGFFGLLESDDNGIHWNQVETASRAIDNFTRLGDDLWIAGMGHVGGQPTLMRLSSLGELQYFPQVQGRIAGADTIRNSLFIASRGTIHEIGTQGYELRKSLTTPFFLRATRIVAGSTNELWVGIDNQTYRYTPDKFEPETTIESGANQFIDGDNIVIKLGAIERFVPLDNRREYQYSIKTNDRPWSPFLHLVKDIPLENLGLGKHQIQVRVRDESGQIDSTPASIAVSVLPLPLQSQYWFRPTLLAIFLSFVALAIFATVSWRRAQRLASGLKFEVAKQTERLSSSERKYRLLFEDSQDAIGLFGADGLLQKCNPAARTLLGVSDSRPISLVSLFSNATEARRFQEELQHKGSLRGLRFRIRNSQGKPLDSLLSVNSWAEENPGCIGHQVIIRDISDLVQLQRRLSETKKMEAIGRLAGGIAHDFNNFLAVMMYGADLIKLTSQDQDNAAIEQGVHMILEAADRAKALTSKIQTFSRAPSLNTEVIDPQVVLKGMGNLLLGVIPPSVKFTLEVDPKLGHIHADPQQLEQVILNLVVNACHAMPNGGSLTVEATNVLIDNRSDKYHGGVGQASPFVRIRITDTGTGMAPETLEKIFDPFFTTKPQGHGTGLGLAIVYGIVQQFGGKIEVHSQVGEGTVFEIDFPKQLKPAVEQSPNLQNAMAAGGSETILLVEDEKSLRDLTRQSLESLGYKVLLADNGKSAIAVLEKNHQVHLVISDVVMPVTSGFELHRWLKKHCPEVRILLVSGYPETSDSGKEKKVDVPFLQKPFRPSELAERIRSILDSGTSTQASPVLAETASAAVAANKVSLR